MDDPHALVEYLAERDEPCPRCGYNLRALRGVLCPECGSALRLRVGLVEPKIAAYVLFIAFTFLGFGGALLFTLLAFFEAGLDWFYDDGVPSSVFLLVLLVSTAVIGTLGLIARRLFLRRSLWIQWGAAVFLGVYVAALFSLVLFFFSD